MPAIGKVGSVNRDRRTIAGPSIIRTAVWAGDVTNVVPSKSVNGGDASRSIVESSKNRDGGEETANEETSKLKSPELPPLQTHGLDSWTDSLESELTASVSATMAWSNPVYPECWEISTMNSLRGQTFNGKSVTFSNDDNEYGRPGSVLRRSRSTSGDEVGTSKSHSNRKRGEGSNQPTMLHPRETKE
ncbi:hypothetical protein BD410DRAFT_384750 [Rickenella mellea]|uniref:Uncharacterized protein n=1 Tax=Rickenella mellea TaxID=50990 RepID=A0A4Y7PZX6_9AGAM|nr:hypothetical protein BD410DRAFT_384750 [Rickenella mellea]